MAAKPIQISSHARFEMARRGISTADVIRTVRHPGQVVPSIKGRGIYQSLIGRAGRLLLRVVVKETGDTYLVVTAYKTSKIAKYWRTP
jgi:hypothetical protein